MWFILQPVVLGSYFIIFDVYYNKSIQLFIKALEWFAKYWVKVECQLCVIWMAKTLINKETEKEFDEYRRQKYGVWFSPSKKCSISPIVEHKQNPGGPAISPNHNVLHKHVEKSICR